MRIEEGVYHDCKSYSCELQERVSEVFQYASQRIETEKLLDKIKKESDTLRQVFWSEEDINKTREAVSFFDTRMQAMVYYTLKNIEGYQQYGWKEVIYKEEGENGKSGSL